MYDNSNFLRGTMSLLEWMNRTILILLSNHEIKTPTPSHLNPHYPPFVLPPTIRIECVTITTTKTVKSRTIRDMSTETSPEPTKAGVSSPDELRDFVSTAGSRLLVVDVRHPDSSVEPGDVKSLAVAGFPEGEYRPMAVNLPWTRDAKSMELPSVDRDTPIITHCGGGGRGQKAKEYLMKNGFTNVLNGGGPKETACWAEYGSK